MIRCLLGLLVSGIPGEHAPEGPPYVLVLGTAQDAGLPQIGCELACCREARERPELRRLVTSLVLCDPGTGGRWLFDASPDLREQVERARGHPPERRLGGARPPLFDGIFLTHAHMGHYTGLLQLGPEAYGAKGMRVYGTPSMQEFLRGNDPWQFLVKSGALDLETVDEEHAVVLAGKLKVEALLVPHRRELTDTCAFRIRGPHRSLLYLPDIDKWERWERRIEDVLASVDYALLDGTFFADGEVPGRSMAEIPHPFIQESLERLGALPLKQRRKVFLTHLNHTNPAADPGSEAAAQVLSRGMSVAREGQRFDL